MLNSVQTWPLCGASLHPNGMVFSVFQIRESLGMLNKLNGSWLDRAPALLRHMRQTSWFPPPPLNVKGNACLLNRGLQRSSNKEVRRRNKIKGEWSGEESLWSRVEIKLGNKSSNGVQTEGKVATLTVFEEGTLSAQTGQISIYIHIKQRSSLWHLLWGKQTWEESNSRYTCNHFFLNLAPLCSCCEF